MRSSTSLSSLSQTGGWYMWETAACWLWAMLCCSDCWRLGFRGHGGIDLWWGERIGSQSIGLWWRMVMRINAHLFHMSAVAQGSSDLQQEETDPWQGACPCHDRQNHDELDPNGSATNAGLAATIILLHAAESAPAVVVVDAPTPVEQACCDQPPGSTEAVDRTGIHRVIDAELLQQHGCCLIHNTSRLVHGRYPFSCGAYPHVRNISQGVLQGPIVSMEWLHGMYGMRISWVFPNQLDHPLLQSSRWQRRFRSPCCRNRPWWRPGRPGCRCTGHQRRTCVWWHILVCWYPSIQSI